MWRRALPWFVLLAVGAGACSRDLNASGGAGSSGGGAGGRGGMAASGGAAGQGGQGGAAACAGGAVSFRIEAPDPSNWFVMDSGQDCAPPNWLAIYDQSGQQELAIGNPDVHCCNVNRCDTCAPDVVCWSAWQTSAVPATRTWNGMMIPKGTCGSAGAVCVNDRTCAPPGQYLARMCGRKHVAEQEEIVCVDVPFTLPAADTVLGVLPAARP